MTFNGSIDHVVFRVAEIGRTRRFYSVFLGEPEMASESMVLFRVGPTMLFFTLPLAAESRPIEKEQIGFNHFAFAVTSLEELQAIGGQLDGGGIVHSGVKIDAHGGKEYIWLDDPDGLRLEFYLRLKQGA